MKLISHGPFLGNLTQTGVKVWFRSSIEEDVSYVVRLFQNDKEINFQQVNISKETDYTACVSFDSLKEFTTYEAIIYYKEQVVSQLNFETKKKEQDALRFVFGSCRYNHWHNIVKNDAEEGDKTYEEILNLHNKDKLDFLLFLGDQIYADPTYSVGVSQNFEEFSEIYRDAFKLPNFQELLSKVSSYMVLDDHEIRNNWSRDMLESFSFFENREEIHKNGLRTYQLWQHSRNPDTKPGQYWYTFEENGHPFFVMDIRTQRKIYRRKNSRRTILGDKQLGGLLDWLYSTKGQPVRFIGSGVPFFPDTVKQEDKWCAFPEERDIILEFLRVEGIGKTVFLSGDVHIGMFSKMTCVQDEDVEIYNLISSPLYWPYRGMYIEDFHAEKSVFCDQWTDSKRRHRGMFEYKYETSSWLRENQFAEVTVNKDGSGMVRHFDMDAKKFGDHFCF